MSRMYGPRRISWLILTAVLIAAFPTGAYAQLSDDEWDDANNDLRKAAQLCEEGKADQAVKLLEARLERVKRLARPGDAVIGAVSNQLGQAYYSAGNYAKAEVLLREAVKIGKALSAEEGKFRHSALNALVGCLLKQSKFTEVVALCEESLRDIELAYGPKSEQADIARDTLCQVFVNLGISAEFIPKIRACLKSAEARYGADHPETIRFRQTLGFALIKTGELDEAKSLFEISLAIAEKKLPPGHELATNTRNSINQVNQLLGKVKNVVSESTRVVNELKARSAPPIDIVQALSDLALAYQNESRFAEAERTFKEALELARAKLPAEHETTAGVLSNFSLLMIVLARFDEAARYLQESNRIALKLFGPNSPQEAAGKVNLAGIYGKTGRLKEARELLEQARPTLITKYGENHPSILQIDQFLASLKTLNKDFKAAIIEGNAALKGLLAKYGGDNRFTALVRQNLGQAYIGNSQFNEAEHELRLALDIMTREVGPVAHDTAYASNALAGLYMIQGRFPEAKALFEQTIEICQRTLGEDNPATSSALDNLATLLSLAGQREKAFDVVSRSRRSRRNFLAKTLPTLSQADQITLVDAEEKESLNQALSLALKRANEPAVAAKSAEWVLNSKALTLRALSQASVLARDLTNPEARQILEDLIATRAQLAKIYMNRDDKGLFTPEATDHRKKLEAQEIVQSRQLGLAIDRPIDEPWLDLEKIRGSIPADAIVVEFAKLSVYEFDSKLAKIVIQPAHYAAWVIPATGSGEPTLIDLGLAKEIDELISAALASLQAAPDAMAKPGAKEADVEKASLVALQALSDRIYLPLAKQLKPAKRWVLSPDAALWLVPWNALPIGDRRYAIEDHLIHLVVSSRDLIQKPSTTKARQSAILASPNYDLEPGLAVAVAKSREPIKLATRGGASGDSRATFDLLDKDFKSLLGFQAEAKGIAPYLQRYAGGDVDLLLDDAASETAFKGLQSPKVLVLTTHGFFIGGPEPIDETGAVSAAPRAGSINPLLRCGLAMAGCNKRLKASVTGPGDDDDGLLTGLEVIGTDLRGTELVVLSACETGLGEIRDGEGIAGLRQSFQIAGAGAVVATLWRVQDNESYQLISAFFESLANDHGPAAALREAQLALIGDRRGRVGAAHPAYWAAFSLTGFPGPAWNKEPVVDAGSSRLPKIPPPLSGIIVTDPLTGRPMTTNPWPDFGLSVILVVGAGFLTRWWWRQAAVSL